MAQPAIDSHPPIPVSGTGPSEWSTPPRSRRSSDPESVRLRYARAVPSGLHSNKRGHLATVTLREVAYVSRTTFPVPSIYDTSDAPTNFGDDVPWRVLTMLGWLISVISRTTNVGRPASMTITRLRLDGTAGV